VLEIEKRWEEEGLQHIVSENGVYEKLGFKQDDEKERKATKEGVDTSGQASKPMDDCDDDLGYMGEPLHDEVSLCDWKKPLMMLESRYKDMPTFQLAIRQFAINREFELGIEATYPFRFRGYYKRGECPWRINTRVEIQGSPTVIVRFFN
jgi:hypothetical protein